MLCKRCTSEKFVVIIWLHMFRDKLVVQNKLNANTL